MHCRATTSWRGFRWRRYISFWLATSGGALEWIKKTLWTSDRFNSAAQFFKTCVGVHPTMVKKLLFLPERFDADTNCSPIARLHDLVGALHVLL